MRTALDRKQLRLVTGSLLADDGRASHHGTYAERERRDEIAAVRALYPVPRTRVDNVVPIRPTPEPPRAA